LEEWEEEVVGQMTAQSASHGDRPPNKKKKKKKKNKSNVEP
jgi:hypothetical protein